MFDFIGDQLEDRSKTFIGEDDYTMTILMAEEIGLSG